MITPNKKPAKKKSNYSRKVVWSAVALVFAGVVALFFLQTGEEVVVEEKQSGRDKITGVAPATPTPAPTNETKEVAKVEEKWTPENDRVHRDENKRIIYNPNAPLGSKANPINIDAMKFPNNPIQPKRKLFDTYAENYICGLMRTKPGTRIIPVRLPTNFDEEFIARIADPVRITKEDTEEDIELKNQMHEFKKACARLIAEGKTPTEIILNERKELNKIADRRAVCAAEIGRLKREGASEQEIEDCVNAANSMMEQYGARKFMTESQIKKMLLDKNK